MLKIKDNVDLDVLKKYGFDNFSVSNVKNYILDTPLELHFEIDFERNIYIHADGADYKEYDSVMHDVLFDLITDGLVEKINTAKIKTKSKEK